MEYGENKGKYSLNIVLEDASVENKIERNFNNDFRSILHWICNLQLSDFTLNVLYSHLLLKLF